MTKETDDALITAKDPIRHTGVAICIASVLCALNAKSGGDAKTYRILFFVCVSILIAVSVMYLVARLFSAKWRSEAHRDCFRPYLIGAMIWLVLIPLLLALART